MAPPRIYLDNAATTPVDPRVRAAMLPYFESAFGNPDSRSHPYGWEAEEAVAVARERVAALLGARPEEIVFTGSATESNNLALFGVMRHAESRGGRLVTTAIEHAALLEPARRLRAEGHEVVELLPDGEGRIDAARVEASLEGGARLVSVMHANNEIGVRQDLAAIGAACARRGALFHTDATQSFGKVPIEVAAWGVHLLSCSAHKIHGPKGVGALYIRRRNPRVALEPLLFGGGQERGLRPGTLNVPGIVGFGEAARLAREEMEADAARIDGLRRRLEEGILAAVPDCRINGAGAPRLPGIASLTFADLSAESLLLGLRGVACSAGSACASSKLEPSHVLLALGRSAEEARNSLRLSLGRFNTAAEVDLVIEELSLLAARLRSESGSGPAMPARPGGRRAAGARTTEEASET